jgi:hypothetical protein
MGKKLTAKRLDALIAAGDEFEVWMAIAQAAFDRKQRRGTKSLTPVQRTIVAVWEASGVIGNRGFFDISKRELAQWALAYDEIGLRSAGTAVREAAVVMAKIDWDSDDPKEQAPLDKIERRYYASDERAEHAVFRYIKKNKAAALVNLV